MGMTITEKIFARASRRDTVTPGEIVNAYPDYVMLTDTVASQAYNALKEMGIKKVFDNDRVIVVIDHAAPPCALAQTKRVVDDTKFAAEYNITHFFNMKGISHQLMVENGFVTPGAFVLGSDSHTVTYGALGAFSTGHGATEATWAAATGELWFRVPETIRVNVSGRLKEMVLGKDIILQTLKILGVNGAIYKTLEFGGEAIRNLSIDGRLTICNMSVETGAKNGIIEADDKVIEYLKNRTLETTAFGLVEGTDKKFEMVKSDSDCKYHSVIEINGDELEPMVACPHSPDNVVPITQIAGEKIDQILLGSCTAGRMEDYRLAAKIMKGKKIPRHIRCLVIPASSAVAKDMAKEGLTEIFLDCGCIVCNSQCGPCGGVQMGFIGAGEACLGTHNRNFKGRMGSPEGRIFLASSTVAAASALTGVITDPRVI